MWSADSRTPRGFYDGGASWSGPAPRPPPASLRRSDGGFYGACGLNGGAAQKLNWLGKQFAVDQPASAQEATFGDMIHGFSCAPDFDANGAAIVFHRDGAISAPDVSYDATWSHRAGRFCIRDHGRDMKCGFVPTRKRTAIRAAVASICGG